MCDLLPQPENINKVKPITCLLHYYSRLLNTSGGKLQSLHQVLLLISPVLSNKASLPLPPVQSNFRRSLQQSFQPPAFSWAAHGLSSCFIQYSVFYRVNLHFCLSSILSSSYLLLQDLDVSPCSFCSRTDLLVGFYPWLLCGPRTSTNHSVQLAEIIDSALSIPAAFS